MPADSQTGQPKSDRLLGAWAVETKRLRLRGFGQLFRSFSLNSYGYSPQTIEKPDSNPLCLARFLPHGLLALLVFCLRQGPFALAPPVPSRG
ncbi:MAG: hypothetical protein ABI389_07530, partial [Rhodanobacter sp.]